MSSVTVESLSVQPMTGLLTAPYRRGSETLVIPLGIDGVNGTDVVAYDFKEYWARYGADPAEPKYVLFPKKDTGRDPLEIEVDFSFQGGQQTALLKIPPRSFASTSFAIPLPAKADATLRLLRFRQRPVPLPGAGANNFGILALLGNISKLVWVLGWEKDQIRQHLRDVQQQRRRDLAHGFSLDLLGTDLRIPRFPPREYSVDDDTLALYHFTDPTTSLSNAIDNVTTTINVRSSFDFPLTPPFQIQIDQEILIVTAIAVITWTVTRGANASPHADGAVVTLLDIVVDETIRFDRIDYPRTGHSGTNKGAQSGVIGKFGNGFRFPGPNGNGTITIANHADFDLSADRSFTVEAFVNADPTNAPGVILLKGQTAPDGALTASGWSLSIVNDRDRGISNNIRWMVFDGNQPIETFADLSIADGKFHHLAGVLDRASQRTRLFVDGEERASVDISALGALTNGEVIRIGRSPVGHSLSGIIDEVRFSKVARTDFHPVLGEGDEAYRQRLGIFERWLLPTPDALLATINNLVRINGEAESFVLVEKDRPSAGASKLIRILPASLPAGQSIDRDGNSLSEEGDVFGLPEEDVDFNPILLLKHERPQVDYGTDPNNHLMQSINKARLDALVDLLAAANPPIAGNLIIDKAFDEAEPGLYKVGRAVLLRHQNLASEQLGVMAHRVGFDFVRNNGTDIYASVAPGEKLEIAIEPRPANETPPAPIDVFMGKAIDLDLVPTSLPATGQVKWTLIPCGAAIAHFVAHPADNVNLRTPITSRSRLRLIPDTLGEITVQAEYTFQRRMVSGTRTIRISIDNLADQPTIAADGNVKISEAEAVGSLGEAINPIYLVTSDVSGVDYGADPNNKKMQIVLERAFNSLLKTQPGLATGLQVLKAFDPNDAGLHKAGRALLLTHNAIAPKQLGALAHQAGFGFVRRQGAQIYCSVAAGEKIEIAHAGDLAPLDGELVVGTPVDLRVRFDALPGAGNFNWSLSEFAQGRGSFDFVLRPAVRFTPRQPGLASLNITYLEQDPTSTFPYAFEIKLKPELEANNSIIPKHIIPKHQYDLIMNILNYFHPIGVEIVTGNIRKHVVDIEQDPQKAFPAYTYPDFKA